MNDHDPSSSSDFSPGDHSGSDADAFAASPPRDPLEGTFTRVAQNAAELLSVSGATVLCGVTFLRAGQAGTVISNNDTARMVDEIQYRYNEGACLTAARTGQLVHLPDITTTDTSPASTASWDAAYTPDYTSEAGKAYREALLGAGIASVLAVPVELTEDTRCALNFYSTIPHAFTPPAVILATRFAADSASALLHAAQTVELAGGMQDLTEAFQSRSVIDVSVGLLMARYTCTREQALRLLIAAATERSVSVHDVADGILTTTSP